MANPSAEFAQYCCELLATVGPCVAKRMFGGWGIRCYPHAPALRGSLPAKGAIAPWDGPAALGTDGLTVAIVANLGDGEILWLKANAETRARFEAEGCARFTYLVKGQPKSMDYYSAPADAMESPALMAPWARLALQAALVAQKAKPVKKRTTRLRPA